MMNFDGFLDNAQVAFSTFIKQLSELDSPLAASSVIVAALIFSVKSFFAPLWKASAAHERRVLSGLSTALTYPRFHEVVGREPNAYRDLNIRNGSSSGVVEDLQSRFFVLRRTYVEAFVDKEDRVYGYTVTLRKPTRMGAVNFAGLSLRLGHTSMRDAWKKGGPCPELIGLPAVRSYSVFEVSRGSGASTGRTWACGFLDSGAGNASILNYLRQRALSRSMPLRGWLERLFKTRREPQKVTIFEPKNMSPEWQLWNAALQTGELGAIGSSPVEWATDPQIQRCRGRVRVNSVAVALADEIRFSMLDLHTWDTFKIDPPKMPRRRI